MGTTVAQIEAAWITHGNIARLQWTLDRELNEGRRIWLEGLLKEQRMLAATLED